MSVRPGVCSSWGVPHWPLPCSWSPGTTFTLRSHQLASLISAVVWEFLYFSYQWALSGKTIGMAVLGIRVVSTDGAAIGPRQAVVRTLVFPLSFVLFGLGFLGILTNRDRHAWHDRIAGTAVVYSWDARAARLRWLAKQETVTAHQH